MRIVAVATSLLVVVSSAAAQQLDPAAVRRALLDGTGPVGGQGVPGPLALFEERAVPVLTANLREGVPVPVVAVSTLGSGRVVAFGHPGYFTRETLGPNAGLQRFLRNAVRWAGGTSRPVVLAVRAPDVASFLAEVAEVRVVDGRSLTAEDLAGVQVIITNPWTEAWWMGSMAVIRRFAESGGGLIVSGLGWGQLQVDPSLTLQTLPASRLLVDAGIGWGRAAIGQGSRPLDVADSPLLNGVAAMRALGGSRLSAQQSAVAVEAVGNAIELAPASSPMRAGAAELAARAWTAQPVQGRALRTADQPLEAIAWRIFDLIRAGEGAAHPAAADFPGTVPAGAPRVTDTVVVIVPRGRWASTGLYAPPGATVRATVIEGSAPAGALSLQVGSHSDELYHLEEWQRAPKLVRRYPFGASGAESRSPFGGLVYVVRDGGDGPVRVAIEGAVRAPRFVLGSTSLEAWRSIRMAPAPWGEIESGSVIFTVQSEFLRTLDRPDEVLQLWDRVQDANRDLAGWNPGENRPMRLVVDRQISAGYMHSGYPIMAPLGSQPTIVGLPAVARSQRQVDVWGYFHELGHNHQSGDWTFDGTGEVTVNLFTMYAVERAIGRQSGEAHPEMNAEGRRNNLRRYFSAGARFDMWKREPFIALMMYRQVVDAFGWEPFRAVFREYRAIPGDEKRWNDDQKRDQWLIRLSRAVGRNLGPFFDAWGVPVSREAVAAVSSLPAWMPEPGFPAAYR